MAENVTVDIGENSPEYVALTMTRELALIEGRHLFSNGDNPVDRVWYLDTYAECLRAVKNQRMIK